MKYLTIALQFLTVLPLRLKEAPEEKDLAKSLVCFPVAGLVIGYVLYLTGTFLVSFLPSPVTSTLLVILLVLFTGALHLDGLADTAEYTSRRILELAE